MLGTQTSSLFDLSFFSDVTNTEWPARTRAHESIASKGYEHLANPCYTLCNSIRGLSHTIPSASMLNIT